ncbi:MAG: hypothetical protein QM831_28655 [Kofleriaceae bacterium]
MRALLLLAVIGCDAAGHASKSPPALTGRPVVKFKYPDPWAYKPRVETPSPPPPEPESPPPEPLDDYVTQPTSTTEDGAYVIVVVSESAGARGPVPNGTLEIRDRHDRVVDSAFVKHMDEVLTDEQIQKRAARADKLIGSHEWQSFPLELDEDHHEGDDYHVRYVGGDLVVEWRNEHFTITQNGKRVVDRAVPQAWRGTHYHLDREELDCDNPDFLQSVRAYPAKKLAVVTVAYRGNDTCWEPGPQEHVVAW